MYKTVLFLYALITFASALRQPIPENFFLKIDPAWEGPKVAVKPSVIQLEIDNQVTAIHVNGNMLPLQFSEKDSNLGTPKKMTAALFRGDIITISGKDWGGVASLLASIQFFDLNGKETIYNSNESWFCNGKPAVLVKNCPHSKKPLPAEAQWIWAAGKVPLVKCSFKIPCDA